MDLGATICTPRKPACALCPWMEPCLARLKGLEAVLPVKAPKKARPTRYGTAFVVRRTDGAILLRRRPPQRAPRRHERSAGHGVAGGAASRRRKARQSGVDASFPRRSSTPSRTSRSGSRCERADVGLGRAGARRLLVGDGACRRSAAERHEKGHRGRLSGRDETAGQGHERNPPHRPRRRQGAGPLRSAPGLLRAHPRRDRAHRVPDRRLLKRMEHRAGSRTPMGGRRSGGDRPPPRQGRPDPRLPQELASDGVARISGERRALPRASCKAATT